MFLKATSRKLIQKLQSKENPQAAVGVAISKLNISRKANSSAPIVVSVMDRWKLALAALANR